MIKAFFLDFYGTVVHEDGEIIKKITQIIYDTGKVENKSEIDASSPIPIYIVSNIDTADILKAIGYHNLTPTGVFTSEDAKAYKPRKELFEMALRSTDLKSDEVIHIGDSINSDVKGASSVNIKALWLNRFGKEIPDGVESITNLLGALDKVN